MQFRAIDILPAYSVNKKIIYSYIKKNEPIVLKNFGTRWKACNLWDFDYLKKKVKNISVPLYNNIKSDAYTPVNKADAYMSFDKYIEHILQNPEYKWRLFLFNIRRHAPELLQDIDFPDDLFDLLVKQAPMLFIGGKGAVTHMHFDIDFSTVLHVQLYGRKKFLLLPFNQQYNIYRKPFEVLTWIDFSNYPENLSVLEKEFPGLKNAVAYELVLEKGDALVMPPGCWHHIEYIDNSIAISMRAINKTMGGILRGLWYLTGMRWIDTFMKKKFPIYWNNFKVRNTVYADDIFKKKFVIHHSNVQVNKPSSVN